MPASLSNPHLAAWDASLVSSTTEARALAGGLTDAQLLRRPSWGGWSVGQVFEHLCVTDGLYEAPLRALVAAERARPTPRLANEWSPTLAGRFLLWSLAPTSTRRVPAPAKFRPADAPRANVVDAWLAQVERSRAIIRDLDGLDLRRLRLVSPAASFIRLNAGDAIAVMEVHLRRHLGQVRRTLADANGH